MYAAGVMQLSSIHVYPVKGARGITLERADVLRGGLHHDRRFMLVDEDGVFVTQRTQPKLALVETALGPEGLTLSAPAVGSIVVPFSRLSPTGALPTRRVTVWRDVCEAVEVPGDVSAFFRTHLGIACTLVFMPDDVVRPVDPSYGRPGDKVGFADGFPVLLASLSSLAELNARLDTPVPMDRFRPNLVVEGGAPFDEDRFGAVRVGAVTFRMPKRCSRCQVTTIDQATATAGKEPLQTLSTYRKDGKNVYFAVNLIPDGEGTVAVGDAVTYTDPI